MASTAIWHTNFTKDICKFTSYSYNMEQLDDDVCLALNQPFLTFRFYLLQFFIYFHFIHDRINSNFKCFDLSVIIFP